MWTRPSRTLRQGSRGSQLVHRTRHGPFRSTQAPGPDRGHVRHRDSDAAARRTRRSGERHGRRARCVCVGGRRRARLSCRRDTTGPGPPKRTAYVAAVHPPPPRGERLAGRGHTPPRRDLTSLRERGRLLPLPGGQRRFTNACSSRPPRTGASQRMNSTGSSMRPPRSPPHLDELRAEPVPDEVVAFWKEASSETGASLDEVTPTVRAWLEGRDGLRSFTVRRER